MFLLLCDVSPDGQITRRRPRVSEVMAVAGATLDEVESVVRAFQRDDRNFLLPPAPAPLTEDTALDLSHEAILRQWKESAKWLDQERQDTAELRRLAEQADLQRRRKGELIQARDLGRIGQWEQRVSPQWSRRYVPESTWTESMAFLAASRKRAKWVRNALLGAVLLLVLTTTASVVAAFWARQAEARAKAAQVGMETALANSFFRTIGVSDFVDSPPEERAALWDLAELDNADVARATPREVVCVS